MNTFDRVRRYVEQHGYRVETFAEGIFRFRYQLNSVHAVTSEDDPQFLVLTLPGVEQVFAESRAEVVERCQMMTARCKLVKAYVVKDHVSLSVEFYYKDEDDFDALFAQALTTLVAARGQYRKMVCGV